jgi:rod shape-determining protein MreC
MDSYTDPPEGQRGRGDLSVALVFLFLSVVVLYLPNSAQTRMADALRGSVLRPFVAVQEALAGARSRSEDVATLQASLDSLTAVVASQASLLDENRRLRELLDLKERVPGTFVYANVIRPGTAGSQSMFLLDVGSEDGVAPGDPVLMRSGRIGLVGVVREVGRTGSIGLDWSHPDFRASATTVDGGTSGLVEPRPGEFRGGERLLLNAIPYYEPLATGTLITTSGLGGIFPRGIPIGEVWELHQNEGNWRREYWLRPIVDLSNVTQVLVARSGELTDQVLDLLAAPDSAADGLPGRSGGEEGVP